MNEHHDEPSNCRENQQNDSPDMFVAEIMEREYELAAEPEPQPKQRSPIPMLVVLLLLLFGLLAWNLARIVAKPPAFTAEEVQQERLFTLFVTSRELETHLDTARTLPPSLETLDLELEGLSYQRVNDSVYVLTAEAGTTQVAYRRGDDLSRFATVVNMVGGGNER